MARNTNFSKPKDVKGTLLQMGSYLGRHKLTMAVIAILVAISAGANILGTYLLKPVINTYIIPGDIPGLVRMVCLLYTSGRQGDDSSAPCDGIHQAGQKHQRTYD